MLDKIQQRNDVGLEFSLLERIMDLISLIDTRLFQFSLSQFL